MPGVYLDSRRALWIESVGLLVVADLHWGYAASHQACGNLLPLWGDAELAGQLRGLIHDYRPAEMLWLGDSLHTLAGCAPAEAFLRENVVATTILPGNHDRGWNLGADRGTTHRGTSPATATRGNFFFHHGHVAQAMPPESLEIIGHHHPALSWWDGAGGRLKLPGLVASSRRLILPAFSPWASGSPWNDLLGEDETLFAIGSKRIFAVSRALLLKSRLSA